ncbi:hypothetical protein QWJ34_00885 [Saccharibacillus sp. CPCC 101409]|uniref:hypothetical protein n=1 Tax=Saccharibacillus sp. CPCC 101409 TaxID=3058041 RepID=UPI0026735344|nr:hypothetical protein [Saccharibacillus sp. CPCC 101409]MDO3408314.1 hypothetical protein [Saccharibacillus sp. CPCC 101409]
MTQTEERARLSQWDAILLENLRGLGLSDEELLHRTAEGDLPASADGAGPDFAPLLTLQAEQPELFEQAVTRGYRIKYNTLGGIRTWVRTVFGYDGEIEREEGREGVRVELTPEQRDRLEPVLSIGWTIVAEEEENAGAARDTETAVYRVVPARAVD